MKASCHRNVASISETELELLQLIKVVVEQVLAAYSHAGPVDVPTIRTTGETKLVTNSIGLKNTGRQDTHTNRTTTFVVHAILLQATRSITSLTFSGSNMLGMIQKSIHSSRSLVQLSPTSTSILVESFQTLNSPTEILHIPFHTRRALHIRKGNFAQGLGTIALHKEAADEH